MKSIVKLYGYGVLIVMTLMVSACGSDGGLGDLGTIDTANSTDMSAAQASSFASSVSKISTGAVSAPEFAESSEIMTKAQINRQISYTLNCTSGGNMKASGSITGSISDNGTGVISLQIPITITDWSCQTPLIINGDPYISITGTFSFVNGNPGTQQHITISGGFKSETQSCQISLGTDFNTSGGGHTSGTVCGHSVDITF